MAITKEVLSGSTRGRAIQVTATATPGTTIHTTGTSATNTDEVWLYATNGDTAAITLTVEYGSTGAANEIVVSIPPKSGLTILLSGLVLRGDGSTGGTIAAFASVTNKVNVLGYVNRIAP